MAKKLTRLKKTWRKRIIMTSEPSCLKRLNPLGDSQLIIAGRNGDIESLRHIFRDLVANGYSEEDARQVFAHHSNRLGKTVLHEAAQNSHQECIRYLVQKGKGDGGIGMDPDCLKQGDWTPLMLACTKSNLEVIRILIEAGASLSLKNKDGWTPFHIASREGHEDIIRYFLRHTSPEPWRTKSKNGRTPLHTAALYGRDSIVSLLLSENAYSNVDETDSCGTTPFMDALRAGHIGIAKRLLEATADPYKCDAVGRQAIHLAAQSGQDESIKFLVEHFTTDPVQRFPNGSDHSRSASDIVNTLTLDDSRSMPGHFAAKEGHVSTLEILKSFGAHLDDKDSRGRTPLHLATSSQRTECVRYLLSENIQDTCDCQGIFARQLAQKQEVKELFDAMPS